MKEFNQGWTVRIVMLDINGDKGVAFFTFDFQMKIAHDRVDIQNPLATVWTDDLFRGFGGIRMLGWNGNVGILFENAHEGDRIAILAKEHGFSLTFAIITDQRQPIVAGNIK